MKEKLTLEHIAPFTPHGLKVKTNNVIRHLVFEAENNLNTITIHALLNGLGHKPILRPIDLTNPIKIEGKEIIPLIELANIAFPDKKNWYVEKKEGGYLADGWLTTFFYENGSFIDGLSKHVPKQLTLFKWLYANKFDVEDLIGKNLAIDVNTLENNPYE